MDPGWIRGGCGVDPGWIWGADAPTIGGTLECFIFGKSLANHSRKDHPISNPQRYVLCVQLPRSFYQSRIVPTQVGLNWCGRRELNPGWWLGMPQSCQTRPHPLSPRLFLSLFLWGFLLRRFFYHFCILNVIKVPFLNLSKIFVLHLP